MSALGSRLAIVPSITEPIDPLIDKFGRRINYVRLAITDSCNLRCVYCMPEKMRFMRRSELLTSAEIDRLIRLLAPLGINKVRITGGEPFVRPEAMDILRSIQRIGGIRLHITTNGVLTTPFLPALKELDIAGINLSLDTLDRKRFHELTRRDTLPAVRDCLESAIDLELPLKINAVIMDGRNTEDIVPMAGLTLGKPVDVRFIEEMPFNGTTGARPLLVWNHRRILEVLKEAYPGLQRLPDPPSSTSANYQIPGARGTLGIIAGFSRTFCGSCNRIRITARGMLQTCLYGEGVLDLREMLRCSASDEEIRTALRNSVSHRPRDGWEAEKAALRNGQVTRSMSTIGG